MREKLKHKTKQNIKEENGSMMVEASFIFPMVFLAVIALIYLGLFKLQQHAILYEVQKVARTAQYMVESPGASEIGIMDSIYGVDYEKEPNDVQVENYYKSYHPSGLVIKFKRLYREIFGSSSWAGEQTVTDYADKVFQHIIIFTGFDKASKPSVEMKRSFFSTTITVKTELVYPMPGVLRYFELGDQIILLQAASTVAMSPTDFMRDVDLAAEGIEFLIDKLNDWGFIGITAEDVKAKAKELIAKL